MSTVMPILGWLALPLGGAVGLLLWLYLRERKRLTATAKVLGRVEQAREQAESFTRQLEASIEDERDRYTTALRNKDNFAASCQARLSAAIARLDEVDPREQLLIINGDLGQLRKLSAQTPSLRRSTKKMLTPSGS